MEVVQKYATSIENYIEKLCEGQPAWKVITASVTTTIALIWIKDIFYDKEDVSVIVKNNTLKFIRRLPIVRNKIEKEIKKVSNTMETQMNEDICNDPFILLLPSKGWSKESILEETNRYIKYGNCQWENGFASGAVYNGNEALTKLMTEVYGLSVWTNPLHCDVFPGIRKMEAEVVRMCCSMFNGGANSCGTMTTGGTESIIMACKAYRSYAKDVKGIAKPEILVPITAHAAFDKAAQLLNMKIRHAPVDPNTMKVNVKAMEKLINKRTCMLVGSAPQFSHGTVDPIEELAALALKYDLPLHVDACLGGFLIAFANEAGFPLPLFDFRVKGVTSISCDTHKYGYTPKGSSVILYSDIKFRHHQFFVQPDWPGGIYATPSISGSRPGGIIAASWAALVYHGRDGYVECTKNILTAAQNIEKGIRNIPGIVVVGKPEVSVVAFRSDKFNIYTLSDAMTKRGWNLNALQFPSSIHIAVTVLHTKEGVADKFVADVKEIAGDLIKNPPENAGESAAIYGMAQSVPDRTVVSEIAWCYLDSYYSTCNARKE